MRGLQIPVQAGDRALGELVDTGMVELNGDGAAPRRTVTPAGVEAAGRLIEERRASLQRLCEGWVPEDNPELAALLMTLARDLVREPHAHDATASEPVAA